MVDHPAQNDIAAQFARVCHTVFSEQARRKTFSGEDRFPRIDGVVGLDHAAVDQDDRRVAAYVAGHGDAIAGRAAIGIGEDRACVDHQVEIAADAPRRAARGDLDQARVEDVA